MSRISFSYALSTSLAAQSIHGNKHPKDAFKMKKIIEVENHSKTLYVASLEWKYIAASRALHKPYTIPHLRLLYHVGGVGSRAARR